MENTKKLNKNSKIAVLMGGLSNEREVSLRSGKNAFKALVELGYKDVFQRCETAPGLAINKGLKTFNWLNQCDYQELSPLGHFIRTNDTNK